MHARHGMCELQSHSLQIAAYFHSALSFWRMAAGACLDRIDVYGRHYNICVPPVSLNDRASLLRKFRCCAVCMRFLQGEVVAFLILSFILLPSSWWASHAAGRGTHLAASTSAMCPACRFPCAAAQPAWCMPRSPDSPNELSKRHHWDLPWWERAPESCLPPCAAVRSAALQPHL